ncbi:hypothetical protein [Sphingobacterium sp.]|uniref:hypothetical protein n=1 Tax=Sphingobacterium sp. TaxID=341027 RepID=UPI0028B024A8|nr:hypothetical protein [Sphingobacterium sp.]
MYQPFFDKKANRSRIAQMIYPEKPDRITMFFLSKNRVKKLWKASMSIYPAKKPAVIFKNRWKGELRYFLFAGMDRDGFRKK